MSILFFSTLLHLQKYKEELSFHDFKFHKIIFFKKSDHKIHNHIEKFSNIPILPQSDLSIFQIMQQVLFIGGGNVYQNREDFIEELKRWDYDPFEVKKKWKYSLSEKLGDDYQVAILDMPNKNVALYKEWKIQFEKIFQYLNEDQIIIAHSLGTIFILKYLTENGFPKKIKQLHLVSALIDDKEMPPEESYLGDFSFDIQKIPEIQNICDKIFLYHSKDDLCVPFSQGERLHKILPNAKFEVFEDRGHMNMEEFPELIQNIKDLN